MKNRTLSLLIGTALTLPSLAMAAPETTAAVDMQDPATATTLEAEVGAADNESVSNQSNAFQISETQTISRARVNTNIGQQPMTTEIESPTGQQPMTTEIKAPNGQQPMTTEIKAPVEAYQDSELQTTEVISQDPVLDEPEVSDEDDQ